MRRLIIGSFAVVMAIAGCADMSPTQRGTVTGAGIGAGFGAILGASTSHGGGKRTAADAVIGGAAGALVGNIWSNRMENQKRAMEQAAQGTGVQVSQTPDNRLKLNIPSDISFDTNRSDIKSDFRPILDKLATSLVENQATVVTITGYTDSVGSDTRNNQLSVDRAVHTRNYLVNKGIASGRFNIDDRGEREPIASNDNDTGRARNRRVEIYVAEQQR